MKNKQITKKINIILLLVITLSYFASADTVVNGIWQINATQGVKIGNGSTIGLFVNTSSGNLGFGTITPTSKLQVIGETNTTHLTIASATAASCDLKAYTNGTIYCGTDANTGGTSGAGGGWTNTTTYTTTSGLDINITNTTGSSILYINQTNGTLGIGTTTPTSKLTVVRGTGAYSTGAANYVMEIVDANNNGNGLGIFLSDGTTTKQLFALTHNNVDSKSAIFSMRDNGTEEIRFDTSGSNSYINTGGNFGIATNMTTSTLQVNGTTNTTYLTIASATAASCDLKAYTNGTVYCGSDANSGGTVTGTGTTGNITLWSGTSTIASSVIFQSGTYIGIGTSGPIHSLEASAGTGNMYFHGGDASTRFFLKIGGDRTISGMTELGNVIFVSNSDPTIDLGSIDWYADATNTTRDSTIYLTVRDTGTQRALILDGSTSGGQLSWPGKIGIGTTTPSFKLEVENSGGWGIGLDSKQTPFFSNNDSAVIYVTDSAGGGTYPFNESGNLIIQPRTSSARDIVFATGSTTPTTKMIIDRTGNVGIGTTNPTNMLTVSNNAAFGNPDKTDAGLITVSSGSDDTPGSYGFSYGAANSNSRSWRIMNDQSGWGYFDIQQSTTQSGGTFVSKLTMDNSGKIGIGTTTPTATRRLW